MENILDREVKIKSKKENGRIEKMMKLFKRKTNENSAKKDYFKTIEDVEKDLARSKEFCHYGTFTR